MNILRILLLSAGLSLALPTYAADKELDKASIAAKQDYTRARLLVSGVKSGKTKKKFVNIWSLEKAEEHIDRSDDHLSRARELLLKLANNGDMEEDEVAAYKTKLKQQRDEIAALRSDITQLHVGFTRDEQETIKGMPRADVVKDFLSWVDYIKSLKKADAERWSKQKATRELFGVAAAYSGFYGIHINNLLDSVAYAEDRERIPDKEYEYIRDGVKRFKEFHQQFNDLLGKVSAASLSGFESRQRWAEVAIRPYLKQKVFTGLPTRSPIPALPANPAENLGYIPPSPMMEVMNELPKKLSLGWLKREKVAKQLFIALFEKGLAQDFLKKFIDRGGKFDVVMVEGYGEDLITYEYRTVSINVPRNILVDGVMKLERGKETEVLRALYLAYHRSVIEAGGDPLTKNLIVNTRDWIKQQFVRRIRDGGAGPWLKYDKDVGDPDMFTERYVDQVITTAFDKHRDIWDRLHLRVRSDRISEKEAGELWENAKNEVLGKRYVVRMDDGESWEIQSVPTDFLLTYVYNFFGMGGF